MTKEEATERLNSIKGVFCVDTEEAIDMAISALSAEEADGCLGCEYEGLSEFDEPCTDCKNNYLNKWNPKKTEPSDLISRAELLEQIDEWRCSELVSLDINDARFLIQNAPSVSADRPSGKWIPTPDGNTVCACSVCGGEEVVPTCMGEPTIWNYCPNCGARMENTK